MNELQCIGKLYYYEERSVVWICPSMKHDLTEQFIYICFMFIIDRVNLFIYN